MGWWEDFTYNLNPGNSPMFSNVNAGTVLGNLNPMNSTLGTLVKGDLGKVCASVEAMQQNGLDFRQKGFDGIDDFDPKVLKLLGVAGNTIDTRWDIRAAPRKSRDDLQAC